MDEFGHFGYVTYFGLLELLHKHGSGDVLIMRRSRVCGYLRTRYDVLKRFLTVLGSVPKQCSEASREGVGKRLETLPKCIWTEVGMDLRIEIPKFRERQSKMKSNLPSTLRQPSPNLPVEVEREENKKEKKNRSSQNGKLSFGEFNKVFLKPEEKEKLTAR